jgi:hypothetical protein
MKNTESIVPFGETPASDPGLPASYTGTGKIARLPLAVRNELNRRLLEGEEGRELIAWLNGLPEVQAVLAAHFHGQPIGDMNLSRWKSGGYLAWCEEQIALSAVARIFEQSDNLQQAAKNGLADRMNLVLVGKLALQLQRLEAMPPSEAKAKACRELIDNLAVLKRGEFQEERLRLEREKHAFRRRMREAEFLKWAVRQDIQCASRECLGAPKADAEQNKKLMEAMKEHEKRMRRILGLPETALSLQEASGS